MFSNVASAIGPLFGDPLRYEGEQSAADHDIYGFSPVPPGEPRPAPQLSKGELGIADRLNWDMDHTTQSSYTPTEYVKPWEAEGWGSGDVATTPPTRLQTAQGQIDAQPILPQRPGFRQGQRDYEYMPTEKEQRRERAANLATIARERGTRWQDTPLPGGNPAPEPTYGRWQDAELPNWQPAPGEQINPVRGKDRDEVNIQPVPGPRDDDDTVWTGGSRDFDESTGTYRPGHRDKKLPEPNWWERDPTPPGKPPIEEAEWGRDVGPGTSSPYGYGGPKGVIYSRAPRRERAFNVRDTWRTPSSNSGMDTSSTRNLGDRGVMTDRMKYYRR